MCCAPKVVCGPALFDVKLFFIRPTISSMLLILQEPTGRGFQRIHCTMYALVWISDEPVSVRYPRLHKTLRRSAPATIVGRDARKKELSDRSAREKSVRRFIHNLQPKL
jgi:hypothetical protein